MIYDALIAEEYTDKKTGEEKARFHRVGTLFPAKDGDGFNLEIPPGLSLSGRVLCRPRKDKTRADAAPEPGEDEIPY